MKRIVLCLAILAAGPAWADLEPKSEAWDGLSSWVSALERRVEVQTGKIDLSTLPPNAGLALIGPVQVDPAAIRRFVQDGGRLLIAAEGANADALLGQFEIRATAPPKTRDPLVRLSRPRGQFGGAQPLVANHPGALTAPDRLQALITHADGSAFAFHLRVGAGQALVVADSSLFINLMQRAPGNRVFAGQVAAWLASGGAVAVASGPDAQASATPEEPAQPSLTERLDDALADLGSGPHGAAERSAVDFFLALFLAALVAYLLRVFPGGRRPAKAPLNPLGISRGIERSAGRPGGPAAPIVKQES